MRIAAILLMALTSAVAVPAEPAGVRIRLSYEIYAVGLHVMHLQATADMAADGYHVELSFRSAGLYGAFVRAESHASVAGVWRGDRPVPGRYDNYGIWHGTAYRTVIDFNGDVPDVRLLVPNQDERREPVPADLQRGTIDPLSAMARLLRKVTGSSHCDIESKTFDGLRLSGIAARTVGVETLPVESRSNFTGTALRCDFEGREFAGFKRDESADERVWPLRGSAWFASLVPGGPPVPVRMSFDTRYLGWVTVYLTAATSAPAAPLPGAVR
jgi:hypothetical protein